MPNKSFRPEDFNRPSSQPERSESKDITAYNIDFRPTKTTERPGWKPEVNDRPASAPDWLTVDSVLFNSPTHSSPSKEAPPPHAARTPPASEVKANSYSANVLGQAVKGEYQYAKLGLFLGLATIIGGIILGLNGVTGHTSWTAKLLGLESNINDAAPGVVLFIVGIFFVYITKPRVKLGDLKG